MPDFTDLNVCIPWGAVILFILGIIYSFTPQGKAQRKRDEQKTLERDKKLDKIYGRPKDGL